MEAERNIDLDQVSSHEPLSRFSDRAELYARFRPNYPDSALDFIIQCCGLVPQSVLVDVGSGTGISSRQFACRGVRVIGIEPNDKMRAQAEAEPILAGSPEPEYRTGQAEATGLPDAVADTVLAAQAFHWFRPEPTLAEFRRILKPRGWTVLMWNERDEADSFTAAYGAALRAAPEAAEIERERARAGDVLLQTPLFSSSERELFKHFQELDEDGMLGRVFSTSYAPREPAAANALADALAAAFKRHQRDGKVRMCYETAVYVAQRA